MGIISKKLIALTIILIILMIFVGESFVSCQENSFLLWTSKTWRVIGELSEYPALPEPIINDDTMLSTNSVLSDPLLLTVTTTDGWTVKYFGTKDNNGDATAITCIYGINSMSNDEVTAILDNEEYPVQLSRGDGKVAYVDRQAYTIQEKNGTISCPQSVSKSLSDNSKTTKMSFGELSCKTLATLGSGGCVTFVSGLPVADLWSLGAKGVLFLGCGAAGVASAELCEPIECKFESTEHEGHCYYLGGLGKSCSEVCRKDFAEYDEDGTRNEVGSHVYGGLQPPGYYGPPACSEILQILLNNPEIQAWNIGYEGIPEESGVGCYLLNSSSMGLIPAWAGTPETHRDAKNSAIRRVCACKW